MLPPPGMDPTARRHIWDVIARYGRERSVILTTHSMEECEVLCGRISIMVVSGGRLRVGETIKMEAAPG